MGPPMPPHDGLWLDGPPRTRPGSFPTSMNAHVSTVSQSAEPESGNAIDGIVDEAHLASPHPRPFFEWGPTRAGTRPPPRAVGVAYLRTFARIGRSKSCSHGGEIPGPIGGDLSHEFIILAETGESQVFCHKDLIEVPFTLGGYRTSSAIFHRLFERLDVALRRDGRNARRRPVSRTEVPADKRVSGPRHRGRPYFLFRHKVFRAHGRPCAGPGRPAGDAARWAPTASACRRLVGAIIEASHDAAGIVWPVPVAPFEVGRDQSQGRGCGDGRCLAGSQG